MASINTRDRKDGSIGYQVQSRAAHEKGRSQTFDTRSDAERHKLDEEADLAERKKMRSGPSSQSFYKETFLSALTLYRKKFEKKPHEKGMKNTTQNGYEIVLRTVEKIWNQEPFASATFADLKPRLMKQYIETAMATISHMGRPITAKSVASHLAAMTAVFKWRAFEYDLDVSTEVFTRTQLPKGYDVKRDRRPEVGELNAIISKMREKGAAGYHMRLLTKFAIETCARQDEMVAAPWREFDMAKRVWKLPASRVKTSQAREIPLNKRALRILRALRMIARPGDAGPFAKLCNAANARVIFRVWRIEAGVVGLTFHDLRHEGICRLILLNPRLPLVGAKKISGHQSDQSFMRYANLRAAELIGFLDH